MRSESEVAPLRPPKARLFWGMAILLIVNLGGPLVGLPVLALTDLPAATKTLVGGVIVAVAELSLPVVIAILGKSGYAYVKSLLFGAFRRYGPPAQVSPTRYRIGLVMLVLPLAFAFVDPYAGKHVGITDQNRLTYALCGDALLLASLVVLGGDFWDKVRALFVHDAQARFPREALEEH